MVDLILPWPPSGNHMWRHTAGNKHYLTEQARRYYAIVRQVVMTEGKVVNLNMDLEVTCTLRAPDKRRRDMDNAWKVIADGITKAGVWQDDSQIKRLTLQWGELDRDRGLVIVSIVPRVEEIVS